MLEVMTRLVAVASPSASPSSLVIEVHQQSDWRLWVGALLPALVVLGVSIVGWRMAYRSGLEAQREAARLELRRTSFDYLDTYLRDLGNWLRGFCTQANATISELGHPQKGDKTHEEVMRSLDFHRMQMDDLDGQAPLTRTAVEVRHHAAVFPFSTELVRELEFIGIDAAVASKVLSAWFYQLLVALRKGDADGVDVFVTRVSLACDVAKDYAGMCADVRELLRREYTGRLYGELPSKLPAGPLEWAETSEDGTWKPTVKLRLLSGCMVRGEDAELPPSPSGGDERTPSGAEAG